MKKQIRGFILLIFALFVLSASAFATGYEYSADGLVLTDLKGEPISYTGGSCMASVNVSRSFVRDGADDDFIIIAAYDMEGKLISFSFLVTDIEAGKTAKLSALINLRQEEKLGLVKAYVWDELSSGIPLSEIKTLDPYAPPEVNPSPSPDVTPEPTAEPTPEPELGITLSPEQIIGVTDTSISALKSLDSGKSAVYRLASDMQVYINGVLYAGSVDIDTMYGILTEGYGNIRLTDSDEDGLYEKITKDYYAIAMVSSSAYTGGTTKVMLSDIINYAFSTAGTNITVSDDDISAGKKTVTVTKNGEAVAITELEYYDVIAIKYDVNETINNSSFIEITATNETLTDTLNEYDTEKNKFTIGDSEYSSVTELYSELDVGINYVFYLDPFGRLFYYEENPKAKNYAIVERYVDSSGSEYSYINVMTLDGRSEMLFIDSNYDDIARTVLTDLKIQPTVVATARNVPIWNRIIEYSVKSTGRINKISVVNDVVTFVDETYIAASNRLGRALNNDAFVLDATAYSDYNAKTSDYKPSALSKLIEGINYDGILVGRDARGRYCNVIITRVGAVYGVSSDFAVSAADFDYSSRVNIDGEECYSLYAIQNGAAAAEKINILQSAYVYYNENVVSLDSIKKGSVFFYTTDSDGLVNKINIVFRCPTDFEDMLMATDMTQFISLPYMIDILDWGITLKEKDILGDNAIQLLFAPVIESGSNYVMVAPIYENVNGEYYFDANYVYDYSVTSDTKIYSYDMSGDLYGRFALTNGYFYSNVYKNVDFDGYGWLITSSEKDALGDEIQMAFMMVVNGTVTNALVIHK